MEQRDISCMVELTPIRIVMLPDIGALHEYRHVVSEYEYAYGYENKPGNDLSPLYETFILFKETYERGYGKTRNNKRYAETQ